MTIGGWLSDRLARTRPQALFLVPGVAMLGSIPFVLMALFSTSEPVIFAAIFAAETLMFVNTGPCNAIIANVVQPNLRAAAYALAIFAVHFLGDIWSPWLIGKAADMFGDPATMASASAGPCSPSAPCRPRSAASRPRTSSPACSSWSRRCLLSGVVLLAGTRHLPREMALMQAKLKAAPPT